MLCGVLAGSAIAACGSTDTTGEETKQEIGSSEKTEDEKETGKDDTSSGAQTVTIWHDGDESIMQVIADEVNEELSDEAMIQTSIGQWKTQITPLHLNMITAAIANNGEMMTPYMVDRIESVDGRVIKTYKPKSNGQVITEEEAKILQELMVAVVESGTAHKLQGYGYTAAG